MGVSWGGMWVGCGGGKVGVGCGGGKVGGCCGGCEVGVGCGGVANKFHSTNIFLCNIISALMYLGTILRRTVCILKLWLVQIFDFNHS